MFKEWQWDPRDIVQFFTKIKGGNFEKKHFVVKNEKRKFSTNYVMSSWTKNVENAGLLTDNHTALSTTTF